MVEVLSFVLHAFLYCLVLFFLRFLTRQCFEPNRHPSCKVIRKNPSLKVDLSMSLGFHDHGRHNLFINQRVRSKLDNDTCSETWSLVDCSKLLNFSHFSIRSTRELLHSTLLRPVLVDFIDRPYPCEAKLNFDNLLAPPFCV